MDRKKRITFASKVSKRKSGGLQLFPKLARRKDVFQRASSKF